MKILGVDTKCVILAFNDATISLAPFFSGLDYLYGQSFLTESL